MRPLDAVPFHETKCPGSAVFSFLESFFSRLDKDLRHFSGSFFSAALPSSLLPPRIMVSSEQHNEERRMTLQEIEDKREENKLRFDAAITASKSLPSAKERRTAHDKAWMEMRRVEQELSEIFLSLDY